MHKLINLSFTKKLTEFFFFSPIKSYKIFSDKMCISIIFYIRNTTVRYLKRLKLFIVQGGQKTWNNLEFDKLGKIKNLEFYRKIMEKPGTFFKFEFFNNFFIINKCI